MKYFLSGILSTVPAMLFGIAILSFRGEYFFPPYAVMGLVFGISSFGLTLGLFKYIRAGSSWLKGFGLALIALTLAWILALIVLGLLNLTPLCVGQDNGDGNNDLTMCIVQTGLVSFFFSLPLSLPVFATAALVSWLGRRPAR